MFWLILGSVTPGLLIAFAAGFVVRRYAPQLGLIDQPGHRKVHTAPVPLGGGLAIWLGVCLPLLAGLAALWTLRGAALDDSWLPHVLGRGALYDFVAPHVDGMLEQSGRLALLLGVGTLLMLLGLIDDRRGLNWKLRIGVQFAAAIVMVAAGWRLTLFLDAPWLTGVVSVFWIVTLINTFNMLDNMDGLSAGTAAIAAAILAAVMLFPPEQAPQGPQLFVGGFLLALVGALLGFLGHNRPPARLFMGDAGSYFVGFCLATMTISATFAGEGLPRHAILAPLCVLAVPLYDTISVIAIRLRQRRSPFEGDKSHFSHRLVDLGLSKTQAVLVIWLAAFTCGLGAFMLHRVDALGAVIVLLIVGAWLVLIALLEAGAVRRRRRNGSP